MRRAVGPRDLFASGFQFLSNVIGAAARARSMLMANSHNDDALLRLPGCNVTPLADVPERPGMGDALSARDGPAATALTTTRRR